MLKKGLNYTPVWSPFGAVDLWCVRQSQKCLNWSL